jgi:hypothetical protein
VVAFFLATSHPTSLSLSQLKEYTAWPFTVDQATGTTFGQMHSLLETMRPATAEGLPLPVTREAQCLACIQKRTI